MHIKLKRSFYMRFFICFTLFGFISFFGLFQITAVAAIINADSPNFTDVSTAVSKANYGDTVIVPPGSGNANWSNTITLTKGIHLIGPGENKLTLNLNTIGIKLAPDLNSLSEGYVFEISGFTFSGSGSTGVHLTSHGTQGFGIINMHDNTFTNFSTYTFLYNGAWKGVVHNNTFKGNSSYVFRYLGDNATQWNWLKNYQYGTDDVLFFEDNTIETIWTAHSGGHASRIVVRFNDYTTTKSQWPLMDVHGNQTSGVAGMQGAEIYGNTLSGAGTNRIDIRGGRVMFFKNSSTGAQYAPQVRNENCNDCLGTAARQSDTQTFNVQDSYHFLNYNSGSLISTYQASDDCDKEVVENKQFWNQNVSYKVGADSKLSTGIGVGTKSAMQWISSCTDGVGFWVTDEGDWNNNEPGFSGRLYRCTNNSWELYYSPYPYPHPLRSGEFVAEDTPGELHPPSSPPQASILIE